MEQVNFGLNSAQAVVFGLALFLALVWTLPWKGVALWRAARNQHRGWFIALLLVNTLGILEIIYIFAFSQQKQG